MATKAKGRELQEVGLLDILGLLLRDIGIEVLWQRLAHGGGGGLPADYGGGCTRGTSGGFPCMGPLACYLTIIWKDNRGFGDKRAGLLPTASALEEFLDAA